MGIREPAYGSSGSQIAALDPVPQFVMIEDARRVFSLTQERPQAAQR